MAMVVHLLLYKMFNNVRKEIYKTCFKLNSMTKRQEKSFRCPSFATWTPRT